MLPANGGDVNGSGYWTIGQELIGSGISVLARRNLLTAPRAGVYSASRMGKSHE
jgi:hypothetical protein